MLISFSFITQNNRCDECVTSRREDSLRHSRSRINAYRALASPSLIALSSKDPILTAFELSWELRRLSFLEHEFKCEYQVRREFLSFRYYSSDERRFNCRKRKVPVNPFLPLIPHETTQTSLNQTVAI